MARSLCAVRVLCVFFVAKCDLPAKGDKRQNLISTHTRTEYPCGQFSEIYDLLGTVADNCDLLLLLEPPLCPLSGLLSYIYLYLFICPQKCVCVCCVVYECVGDCLVKRLEDD